jgi:hypothetical protein
MASSPFVAWWFGHDHVSLPLAWYDIAIAPQQTSIRAIVLVLFLSCNMQSDDPQTPQDMVIQRLDQRFANPFPQLP